MFTNPTHRQINFFLKGIDTLTYYSTDIFTRAGLKGQWPIYATILLGIVGNAMTFVCMLIVDKAGRKVLLIVGVLGMSFFSFLVAIGSIFEVILKEKKHYLFYYNPPGY